MCQSRIWCSLSLDAVHAAYTVHTPSCKCSYLSFTRAVCCAQRVGCQWPIFCAMHLCLRCLHRSRIRTTTTHCRSPWHLCQFMSLPGLCTASKFYIHGCVNLNCLRISPKIFMSALLQWQHGMLTAYEYPCLSSLGNCQYQHQQRRWFWGAYHLAEAKPVCMCKSDRMQRTVLVSTHLQVCCAADMWPELRYNDLAHPPWAEVHSDEQGRFWVPFHSLPKRWQPFAYDSCYQLAAQVRLPPLYDIEQL